MNINKIISTGLMLYLPLVVFSQGTYPASTIAEPLKQKAHAVVRERTEEFYVMDAGEASVRIKSAITVLDDKGDSYATIYIPYNKFIKVLGIEAELYDAQGDKVKKLKRADIESFSTNSDANSIDDSFVKVASLTHTSYPYTVVYSTEYRLKNMMFYPSWEAYPYNTEGISVESSKFEVLMPANMPLRYKEQNLPQPVKITEGANFKTYTWEVKNLKAIAPEVNAPEPEKILPTVFTAPSDFRVETYTGKLSSWNDVGAFYGSLNKDRDQIPANIGEKVLAISKQKGSLQDKVKQVYTFLQNNTRYVSIQLGIGGWQSMMAQEVATKGYGDCKALTNYMYGMLKFMGIKSHPVLVKAGGNNADIMTDFPSFQFNHIFLCVPTDKDTLWLECTSQDNPFGYLSDFTSDRHALLITENGGQLIKTPAYQPIDNQQKRTANVVLLDNGEATVQLNTHYTGLQYDTPSALSKADVEAQKKWFMNNVSLPSIEVKSFSFKENAQKLPSIDEKLTLSARNVSSKSGTRMFLNPNLFNQQKAIPVATSARVYDIELRNNYTDTDSIWITIPGQYKIEYLPEPVKIESKYGRYQASCQWVNEKILYVRTVASQKGYYPASEFGPWADYRKKLVKADKNQVVLVLK